MAPPIECDLGYRFQTRTLTLTLTLILKLTMTLTLTVKVTIIYAVQNDTQIKFKIDKYKLFCRAGGPAVKGL